MKILKHLADEAILVELGARLARRRLDLQLTQAEVAEEAGIAKRTLERIEAGASTQMTSLIRVLRVLDALPGLDSLLPETGPRPMDLLRRRGKLRQRASRRRSAARSAPPWSWNDKA
jgi:transcriptional regulator with XRE-family HTH domain